MMNIPIPVIMKLKSSNNVLIMGMGGGFDVFSGIPIYVTLEKMGIKSHLASFTHASWTEIPTCTETIPMAPGCLGVTGNIARTSVNMPEMYLSNWFKEVKNQEVPVWTFKRDQSVKEYSDSLNVLVKHLGIDTILLVDGGVDSIMTGNEDKDMLTKNFINSSLILKSVENMKINLISVCINNGDKDSKSLNNILYKISNQGGFYGGCFILNYMKCYQDFKLFCDYYISNEFDIDKNINLLIDNTEFSHEEHIDGKSQSQLLFFNSLALSYNNAAIKNLMGDETYYDSIQKVAPYVNKY